MDVIFYKDGRHEILNETNRLDVFGDISRWLERHVAQTHPEDTTVMKEQTKEDVSHVDDDH